jgi:DMSO/TMAO reductase YedYZ molybdopterin-dependent catalytic subunit
MVDKLPALDVEGPPKSGLERWRLRIDGLVEKPRTFSLDELKALEPVEVTAPFVCVEGWDMWVKWKGVPLRRIIEAVKPLPAACWLTFYAYSEYTDSLPMNDAMDERTLLAYGYEGGGLPVENGGPLRLVVPFKLGYKSVKWLRRISLADEQETGYWEARGYPAGAGISEKTKIKYGIR